VVIALYFQIGYVSALSCLGTFMVLSIPYPFFITKHIESLREKISDATAKRIDSIGEVLTCIKAVKLYVWESKFVSMVLFSLLNFLN
jgi:hypothetical protein